ncbi:MAG TPA: Holliday junction branch migration protein RuvA [Phycisphaerae bacterium]|nr:Holliday junction branch migration protein RuvA [Phycisphaerae bacterium]
MIARINGTVEAVNEESALVAVGELSYEVLVPAVDIPHLQSQVGRRVAFFTLEYIEGNASFGQLSPRLIGFLRRQDKEFFERFITVKGIGPRRALRVLAAPVSEIAAAVNRKDLHYLTGLPEIGKRTAEHVIAELSGKVDEFAGPAGSSVVVQQRTDEQEQAIVAMVSLGEKRPEAENWVDRACRADKSLTESSTIMRAAYRLKAGG